MATPEQMRFSFEEGDEHFTPIGGGYFQVENRDIYKRDKKTDEYQLIPPEVQAKAHELMENNTLGMRDLAEALFTAEIALEDKKEGKRRGTYTPTVD